MRAKPAGCAENHRPRGGRPVETGQIAMIEQTVDIETRDGAMETFICAPDRGGPFAPILFLMDAPGSARNCATWPAAWRPRAIWWLCPIFITGPVDTTFGPDVWRRAAPASHARGAHQNDHPAGDERYRRYADLSRRSRGCPRWAGRLPRLLHERPLRPGGGGAPSRVDAAASFMHLAGQRRRREPAPDPRRERRTVYRLRRI